MGLNPTSRTSLIVSDLNLELMNWKEFLKPNVQVIGLSIIIFLLLFGFPIPEKEHFMCISGTCPDQWDIYFVGGINHGKRYSQYLFTDIHLVSQMLVFYIEIITAYLLSYFISCFLISKFKKK